MKQFLILLIIITAFSCTSKEEVDYIFFNAKIYQVNESFDQAEAFAVKNNRFLSVGSDKDILNNYESVNKIDLAGAPIYPGFIDGHSHFFRYSMGLKDVDLVGSKSFDEVIERLQQHIKEMPTTEWVVGSGWDQNDWQNKDFPTKDTLDLLFPNKIIMLTRIDAHAVITNQNGLDIAGINAGTKIDGGEIILQNGAPTGVLVDNAAKVLRSKMPELKNETEQKQLLERGQNNCFAVGLTSLVDAGLDKEHIDLINDMHQNEQLKMRVYAMITPTEENMDHYFGTGHIKTDYLNVRSFKIYGDGALGSRGACLVAPYSDMPSTTGFLLSKQEEFDSLAKLIFAKNFQMNTHCIGDSANRVITDIYAKYLKGKNDRRWRIEHAQVVTNSDLSKFGAYNILPSVQPTHATSDMYWAADRLGEERVKTAYAYQDLLKQNGKLILGSDFPIEDINPIYGFHSAVARQDNEGYPEGGFQSENALSREEALKGMTLWAAYGQFEEEEKGSIEAGKLADFVILDQDIMEVELEKIRATKVMKTFIGGNEVYGLN